MNSEDEFLREWIEQRRAERADSELVTRIMRSVIEVEQRRAASRLLRWMDWIDRSRVRRRVACSSALLVGSVPLVYLAYISQALPF